MNGMPSAAATHVSRTSFRNRPTRSRDVAQSEAHSDKSIGNPVTRLAVLRWSVVLVALMGAGVSRAGSPEVQRGKALIEKSGCAGCHAIPGVRVAGTPGRVGPPLAAFGRRLYIAGMLPNTPEQLARWVFDPPAINPGTGMPRVGLTEQESRDVAAYLSSLK